MKNGIKLLVFASLLYANIAFATDNIPVKPAVQQIYLPKTFMTKQMIQNEEPKKPILVKSKYLPVTLTDYVKFYPYSYEDTYIAVLISIFKSNMKLISYESDKGVINAQLNSYKDIYITIVPMEPTLTSIKITPSDGLYNAQFSNTKMLLKNVQAELLTKPKLKEAE